MLKKAQVIMLPTENTSKLVKFNNTNELHYCNVNKTNIQSKNLNSVNQHLYIISDDEIKKGDWYCSPNGIISQYNGKETLPKSWEKIIATTDTSIACIKNTLSIVQRKGLTNHYPTEKWILPQPSQQFIEKYIESYNKGNVIENVLVEYEADLSTITKVDYGLQHWNYKLKINPKDNTITIKKLKDSWNREEVIELLNQTYNLGYYSNKSEIQNLDEMLKLENWIEKNL